jgi:hypothetical protein
MPRLVPNPIGDILHPLQQIEKAMTALTVRLQPIEELPGVHSQLVEVNEKLTTVVEAIEAMRVDLHRFYESQADGQGENSDGRAANARRPRAR